MSIIQAAGSGEVSTGFYKLLLDQSLKFDDAESQRLTRTPASAGNRRTFTFSCWVKRSKITSDDALFTAGDDAQNRTQIYFLSNDKLGVYGNTSNSDKIYAYTDALFRDVSAWYNVVVAIDSTDGTAGNRLKIYVNGTEQSYTYVTTPSQNEDFHINNTVAHAIAGDAYAASNLISGYIAEVNFIDGTALTAASFGENKNGIWIPKSTSGLTFGTNGFHLTFKDDVVSEGFNTVTYRGNNGSGTTGQSISGVGFKPALIWIKNRETTTNNVVFDYVRGNQLWLEPNSTDPDQDSGTYGVQSHDADGWTMGGGNDINRDGEGHAAWCWEGGGEPTADNSENAGATPTAGSVKIDGSNLGSALAGSIAATRISANTARGFSIVTYTGTGSNGATVAHGLGAAPTLIFIKSRVATSADGNWLVYAKAGNVDETDYLLLNNSASFTDEAGAFNDTAATSTVFSLGTFADLNQSGKTYVAYCWTSITGYSAIGSFTGNGGSQAIDVGFTPAFVMLRRTGGSTWGVFDNTRQSRNLQMLAWNSTAVETTNAQMNFSGNTFNDNGYLSDNGEVVIYMAFADTREAAFFKDVSGQGNNFTPVNLDYRDSVPDVPTNNFCTWNPLYNKSTYGGLTLAEGNLKVTTPTSNYGSGGTTFAIPPTGKWYAEVYIDNAAGSVGIALNNPAAYVPGVSGAWYDSVDGIAYYSSNGYKYLNASSSSYGATFAAGDIIGIAVNTDDDEVTFYKNNSTQGAISKDATGYVFDVGDGSNGAGSITVWNFGQDSSFAGLKATANSNADGNGRGTFAYAPPTGFLALCSQNLPDADIIDGTQNFNTVLYTAASSNGTYQITGNGFQPDWSWVKNRDDVERNLLFDSVRGNTSMTDKFLVSDATSTEGANGVTGTTVTVNADGMQVVESSIDSGELYFNSRTYVMWNWLAATAFSNDASATGVGTIDSSGRANTTAGFSIVSYTGTGSAGTIKHGLSAAPEMLIVKNRDTARDWMVYHSTLGATKRIWLNYTYAEDSGTAASATWNDTAPTSSVFSIGTNTHVNDSGDDHIAYCFHSVEGYSKVGSYRGNNDANGMFVHLGFRPAWIMIKRADASGEDWEIWDSTRDTDNVVTKRLKASSTGAEVASTFMDFVSNGVKFRNTSGGYSALRGTYIYLAFAESPFKFANAR